MRLAMIVSAIVLGFVILIGFLGHLIDNNAESGEPDSKTGRAPEGNRG